MRCLTRPNLRVKSITAVCKLVGHCVIFVTKQYEQNSRRLISFLFFHVYIGEADDDGATKFNLECADGEGSRSSTQRTLIFFGLTHFSARRSVKWGVLDRPAGQRARRALRQHRRRRRTTKLALLQNNAQITLRCLQCVRTHVESTRSQSFNLAHI